MHLGRISKRLDNALRLLGLFKRTLTSLRSTDCPRLSGIVVECRNAWKARARVEQTWFGGGCDADEGKDDIMEKHGGCG